MTTTVIVRSHNYPVLVRTIDITSEGERVTEERVFFPEDGEQQLYCTTTRRLECVDLERDDPRAVTRRASMVGKLKARVSDAEHVLSEAQRELAAAEAMVLRT